MRGRTSELATLLTLLVVAVLGILARPVLGGALSSDVPPTTALSQLSSAPPSPPDSPSTDPRTTDSPTTSTPTTTTPTTAVPAPTTPAAGLVTLADMPAGWGRYTPLPGDTFPLHLGVCGEPRRPSPPARFVRKVAYAASNDRGPVFGERISAYSSTVAKRVMKANRSRPYPCRWTDVGIKWTAATIPRPHLCDESFAYLQRKLSGNFPYSYEYVVRCGRDVLAFVLSTERPDRGLATMLVRKAVRKYETGGAT